MLMFCLLVLALYLFIVLLGVPFLRPLLAELRTDNDRHYNNAEEALNDQAAPANLRVADHLARLNEAQATGTHGEAGYREEEADLSKPPLEP